MKNTYKKVKLLLSRNSENELFENRTFSIVSLVGAVTCFLSLISNNFIDDHFLMDLIIGLNGVIFIIFFYLSFFKGITKPLIFPFQILIALVLTIGWFFFQGIEGSIPLFFSPALFILIFSNQYKKYWLILISFISLAIVLVGIHYFYPELAIPYPDKNSQILDLSTGFIISLFILGLATIFLKKNFDRERLNLDLKNRELKISEARLTRAELASGLGNWELHVDSQTIIASEGAMKVYGISKTKFDFSVIKKISLPEYREQLDNALIKLLENNEPYNVQFKIKAVDTGEIKDIHSVAVFDEERRIVFGIIQDITGQKQAEKALKESEAHLRTLIQTIPDLIWLKNKDGVFLSCNSMFERFFGAKEAEIVGKTDFDFVDKELAKSFRKHDCAAMALGKPSENEEWITFADDGHRALLDTVKTPMYDSEGKLIGILGIARDITGRKETEEALRQSEEKYRNIFNNSIEGIFQTTLDGRLQIINPACARLVGYESPEEMIANVNNIGEQLYLNPADRKLFLELLQTSKGKLSGLEVQFKHKSGSVLWVSISSRIIKNEKDLPIYIEGTLIDITERKQAEFALRESEEKFRTLFTQMSEGVALHEIIYNETHKAIDYKIIDVNPAFEKHIGISAEKARGAVATQLYGVTTAPYIDIYASVAATGEPQSFQTYFPPFNRYFDISVFSPNTGSFATVFTDITERKLAEKAIKDSQAKLSNAIKIAHLGPWEYDVENDLFTFDDNFYSIFRTNVTEVGGYTMSSGDYADRFVHPDDAYLVGLETRKAIDTDNFDFFGEVEHRFLYADGEVGHLKVCFSIIKDENGKTIKTYGINQDITEQIRAEQILRESEANLLEINAAKDKFFSIIAHDLKSPFNSILGLSNMLVEQIHSNNIEGIVEYAGIIQDSSQRAMDLLLNLLEWSRSQTGKMEFSPEYVEIVALINEVATLITDSALQKAISISKELPPSTFIFADKAMISTILRNLISNAVKFTNLGGKIIVSAKQEQDQLLVSVCDNGVGIKKETISKLFRIDENHSTYGTLNETGTGLGLILCKEFVEKHNGKIWVESTPGKGSTFFFTIPISSGRKVL